MAKTSLIVAAADNNVIGKDNKMPWHISEDFKHFKKITLGKPCIMGRKTYESILEQLGKPLPNRESIVISRQQNLDDTWALVALESSIENAIYRAEKCNTDDNNEIMIIGGAQIYKLALENDLVDRIYMTRVHQSPDGDAFFPELGDKWKEIEKDPREGFSFIVLEK